MVIEWKLRLSIIEMGMFKLLLSQNLVFDFYLEDIPSLKCLGKICFCVSYNVTPLVKMFHGLMGKPEFQNSLLYVLGFVQEIKRGHKTKSHYQSAQHRK